MVRMQTESGRSGCLVMGEEDMWFTEALLEQAAGAVVRVVAIAERTQFSGREACVSFAMDVIRRMAAKKLGEVGMETVRIGNRYYVEITGEAAFERQRLVPFRGFYDRLKAEELRGGKSPINVTPGDLRAVASEKKPARTQCLAGGNV